MSAVPGYLDKKLQSAVVCALDGGAEKLKEHLPGLLAVLEGWIAKRPPPALLEYQQAVEHLAETLENPKTTDFQITTCLKTIKDAYRQLPSPVKNALSSDEEAIEQYNTGSYGRNELKECISLIAKELKPLITQDSGPMDILASRLLEVIKRDTPSLLEPLNQALSKKPHPLLSECYRALNKSREELQRSLEALLDQEENALSTVSPELKRELRELSAQENPSLVELKAVLDQCLRLESGIATEAARVLVEAIEKAGQIFTAKIDQASGRVEQIPKGMLNGVFSSPAVPVADEASSSLLQPASTPDGEELPSIIEKGSSMLSSLASMAGNAMSQKAIRGLGMLLLLVFEKFDAAITSKRVAEIKKGSIHENQSDDPYSKMLEKSQQILLSLQGLGPHTSWATLFATVKQGFEFLKEQQVYIVGFRVPIGSSRSEKSAISAFAKTISKHDKTLQSSKPKDPVEVTPEMIKRKALTLRARVAAVGPMKVVGEMLCGFKGGDAFYAKMCEIEPTTPIDNYPSLIRERFFNEIDQANLSFIYRWSVKRVYDLIHMFSSFYVIPTIDGLLNFIQEWIKRPEDPKHPKDLFLIQTLKNTQAVVSAAYNQVADTPPQFSCDLQIMLENAMKEPQRNQGLSQKELYAAAFNTTIETFGPKIQWIENIDAFFAHFTFDPSSFLSFLNPVLEVFNFVTSVILKAFVIIPQWVGNHLIRGFAALLFSQAPFLDEVIHDCVESLRLNTPTSYALLKLLSAQLKEIQKSLKDTFENQETSVNQVLGRESDLTKLEAKGLIEYSLEVLRKSQFLTQDSLQDYRKHQLPARQAVEKELEDTFMPNALQSASMSLLVGLQSFTKETHMNGLVNDVLKLVNDLFEDQEPVTKEVYTSMQNAIHKRADKILRAAIYYGIRDQFDLENTNENADIAQFFKTFKEEAEQWVKEIDSQLSIEEKIKKTSRFLADRSNALSAADGNPHFHSETKSKLNTLSNELLEQIKQVNENLDLMKRSVDILRSMKKPKELVDAMIAAAQKKSPPSSLIPFINALKKIKGYEEIASQAQTLIPQISLNFEALKNAQNTHSQYVALQSIFTAFVKQKEASFKDAFAIPPSGREVLLAIPQIPSKEGMEKAVKSILNAKDQLSLNQGSKAFNTLFTPLLTQSSQQLQQAEQSLETHALLSFLLTQQHRLEDAVKVEQETLQRLQESNTRALETFQTWVTTKDPFLSWNVGLINWEWLIDRLNDLAFDRAKEKKEQLIQTLYQRHNYFAFLNQAMLIPLIKTHGPHHLNKN
jgi:hypothetical protein